MQSRLKPLRLQWRKRDRSKWLILSCAHRNCIQTVRGHYNCVIMNAAVLLNMLRFVTLAAMAQMKSYVRVLPSGFLANRKTKIKPLRLRWRRDRSKFTVSRRQPSKHRDPLFCEKHQKHFKRYGYDEPIPSNGSWACPDCLAPIKAHVQRSIHPPNEFDWLDRLKGKIS